MDESQNRLENAQTDIEYAQGLRGRLDKNALTQQDLDTLGLTAGENLYNVNLNQFMTQADKIPTLAGVADPEQIKRYAELQSLIGGTNQFEGQDVGGFKAYEYNKDELMNQISQGKQTAETGYTEDKFISKNARGLPYNSRAQVILPWGTQDMSNLTPEQAQKIIDNEAMLPGQLGNTLQHSGSGMQAKIPMHDKGSIVSAAKDVINQYNSRYGIGNIIQPEDPESGGYFGVN